MGNEFDRPFPQKREEPERVENWSRDSNFNGYLLASQDLKNDPFELFKDLQDVLPETFREMRIATRRRYLESHNQVCVIHSLDVNIFYFSHDRNGYFLADDLRGPCMGHDSKDWKHHKVIVLPDLVPSASRTVCPKGSCGGFSLVSRGQTYVFEFCQGKTEFGSLSTSYDCSRSMYPIPIRLGPELRAGHRPILHEAGIGGYQQAESFFHSGDRAHLFPVGKGIIAYEDYRYTAPEPRSMSIRELNGTGNRKGEKPGSEGLRTKQGEVFWEKDWREVKWIEGTSFFALETTENKNPDLTTAPREEYLVKIPELWYHEPSSTEGETGKFVRLGKLPQNFTDASGICDGFVAFYTGKEHVISRLSKDPNSYFSEVQRIPDGCIFVLSPTAFILSIISENEEEKVEAENDGENSDQDEDQDEDQDQDEEQNQEMEGKEMEEKEEKAKDPQNIQNTHNPQGKEEGKDPQNTHNPQKQENQKTEEEKKDKTLLYERKGDSVTTVWENTKTFDTPFIKSGDFVANWDEKEKRSVPRWQSFGEEQEERANLMRWNDITREFEVVYRTKFLPMDYILSDHIGFRVADGKRRVREGDSGYNNHSRETRDTKKLRFFDLETGLTIQDFDCDHFRKIEIMPPRPSEYLVLEKILDALIAKKEVASEFGVYKVSVVPKELVKIMALFL